MAGCEVVRDGHWVGHGSPARKTAGGGEEAAKEKGAGLAARTQRDDSSENSGSVFDDAVSPEWRAVERSFALSFK
jgi:hypothetical protein